MIRTHALLLSLISAPLAAGCTVAGTSPSKQTAQSQQLVRTAAVMREAVAPSIHATGVLIAREQSTLAFKVGGVIQRIYVQPGDEVHPGQVLAQLDTREIDAQVRQAELALQKARRDEERVAKLYANQAIPSQAIDDTGSAARLAEQALEIARFNRDHAVIVAQSVGRVVRRLAEPNNIVAPGVPVLQLNVSSAGYVVRAGLIDRDIVRVALHDKALVSFDAFPERRFAGTLIELAAEPSPVTGIYDVLVRLDTLPPRALSGLVAKIEIPAEAPQPIALVPIEAIVEGDGRSASVYIVGDDGRAHRRRVETAFLVDRKVAVKTGLDGVGRVVTDGAAFLTEGAPVREVTTR